ncbi:hypothetical protein WDW89_05225 [Deltaproteobacteria bacterium TL4]
MSKLIKMLQQVSESAIPPMGFKLSTASTVRKMLIITSVAQITAKSATQPSGFEVDAMLIQSQNLKDEIKNLKRLAGKLGDTPLGIWFESMTAVDTEELKDTGIDFLVFPASQTPAALLKTEIGKVMKIDLTNDNNLITTIDQLPIDAVLIDFRENKGSLNILQLMNCHRLAGLTGKPILVATQQELAKQDIKSLWEAGVNGIIVEAKEENRQNLDNLSRVIKDLPPVTRKPKKRSVTISNPNQTTIPDTNEDM